jgi:RES domain-containing protein
LRAMSYGGGITYVRGYSVTEVHGNGHVPPNQHRIEITIPPGVSYEMFSAAHHTGWDAEDCLVAKAYGGLGGGRSAHCCCWCRVLWRGWGATC